MFRSFDDCRVSVCVYVSVPSSILVQGCFNNNLNEIEVSIKTFITQALKSPNLHKTFLCFNIHFK